MITTRFIVGVPVAAAITFGLFVIMRGMISGGDELPPVIIVEKPIIVIGPTVEDSDTIVDGPAPEEVPDDETERPKPPATIPTDLDTTEVGTGPTYEPEPVDPGSPGRDVCGQPIVRIAPTYPRRAAEQGIEGYAVVEFTVTVQGTVKDVVVVEQEPGNYFGPPAKKAVEGWRYAPCKVNGKIQEVRLQVQLVFKLDQSE